MALIQVLLGGDQPLALTARALSGYHRPLNGAIADLTVTVDPAALFADWLAAPPLGLTCQVTYAGVPLLIGVLYAVQATADAITLRIEG